MVNNKVSKISFIYNKKPPYVFVHAGKVVIENGVAHCKDVWITDNNVYTRLPDIIVSAVNIVMEIEEPGWWRDRHGDLDTYGNS